jgi:hypothetical protein
MHDFHTATSQALPELLRELKAGGYKVVHLIAKRPVETMPDRDAVALQRMKGAITAAAVPAREGN